MRRRKADDGLWEIVKGRQDIRIAIEHQQYELISTKASTFLQNSLEIHFGRQANDNV